MTETGESGSDRDLQQHMQKINNGLTRWQQKASLSAGDASFVAESAALIAAVPPRLGDLNHLVLISVSAALASIHRSHTLSSAAHRVPHGRPNRYYASYSLISSMTQEDGCFKFQPETKQVPLPPEPFPRPEARRSQAHVSSRRGRVETRRAAIRRPTGGHGNYDSGPELGHRNSCLGWI